MPGGIVLIVTGEIGLGVRKEHVFSWDLGDHLYFLGRHTIERYSSDLGFDVVSRQRVWQPSMTYTRERFKTPGRSKLRNAVKLFCVYTPGLLALIRWYMLKRRHADNPVYNATLVLRKLR
jgi:hypothetical protein